MPTDIKEQDTKTSKGEITINGENFFYLEEYPGHSIARRIINLPNADIILNVGLPWSVKKGEVANLKLADLQDFSAQVLTTDFGKDRLQTILENALGGSPRAPLVEIGVFDTRNGVILKLRQREPVKATSDSRNYWQEFELEFDNEGQFITGNGSAKIARQDNEYSHEGFTELQDISTKYDILDKLVFVDFGNKPIGKLLRNLGLPTQFRRDMPVIDSKGDNPLTFGNLAKLILDLPHIYKILPSEPKKPND